MLASSTAVNEKLPASLGTFRSTEFLNLHNLPCDGQGVLVTWKNMLCAIGNINQIEVSLDCYNKYCSPFLSFLTRALKTMLWPSIVSSTSWTTLFGSDLVNHIVMFLYLPCMSSHLGFSKRQSYQSNVILLLPC